MTPSTALVDGLNGIAEGLIVAIDGLNVASEGPNVPVEGLDNTVEGSPHVSKASVNGLSWPHRSPTLFYRRRCQT